MLFRNLKAFIKYLGRNKIYTVITIVGFSISLMFVILLNVYIQKETSVDQFQFNKNRIFRLVHDDYSGFAPPSGPLLLQKFPEVENYTRTFQQKGYASTANGEKIKINYLMVDSGFFTMFSFPLFKGEPERVLQERKSIVLSRSYAISLFGKEPEPGELIKLNDGVEYKLTGIMEDWPENTHFQKMDALVDFPSLADQWGYPELLTNYNNNSFGLYVMAKPNTDLPSKTPAILKLFEEVNWMFKEKGAKELLIEPLTEVYFGSSYSQGIRQNSRKWINILSGIIVLILFLSVFNYINLTIAQAGFRSKEIAIKKLMGGKKQLFLLQYVGESVLLCTISFIIAIMLSLMSEPVFNYLLNTKLNLTEAFSPLFFIYTYLFVIAIGAVAGIIPAMKISAFNPINVIKGDFRMKEKSVYSRVLIAFQYLLISILLISALFIDKQTRFLRNYDLGFDKNHIIWLDNTMPPAQLKTFKGILGNITGVTHVCCVRGNPMDGGNNNTWSINGKLTGFQTFDVDTSFFTMMGMKVRPTGVALSDNMILLNEAAVKAMELPDNPVTAKIYDTERPVYGIVKNFHFKDLRQTLGPAYFQVLSPDNYAWSILIKVSEKNVFETVNKIKAEYKQFTHGVPITMGFMDESINQWYEKEERARRMISFFTLLSIVISVMGLFAMSLYYVQQKIKEIGIRKVNGARTIEVMSMLNQEFLKWVIIAYIIACPIAWFAMDRWLENFAYKTELSWWIFALAGTIAIIIALLTVSVQSFRAANRNPVESLRYE